MQVRMPILMLFTATLSLVATAASAQVDARDSSATGVVALTAVTERGVFSISTNTPGFAFENDGRTLTVVDELGNSAAVDLERGCIGSTGLGSCSFIGRPDELMASLDGASGPGVEGGRRSFTPSDRLRRSLAPIRLMASTSVTCPGPGGDTFDLSTGSPSGNCSVSYDEHGNATGASCDDGAGNTSAVNCALNEGAGGCTTTTGSGTCKVR